MIWLSKDPSALGMVIKLWDQHVLETGVVPLASELGSWIAAAEAQMLENMWIWYDDWKEGARDYPENVTETSAAIQRTIKAI